MLNQLQTWFLADDEAALSFWVRSNHPTVFFIDHEDAATSEVVARVELTDCHSGFAYIWDAGTHESTRAAELWQRQTETQSVNAVVQFLRSTLLAEELSNHTTANVLTSGRVAACFTGKGTPQQIELKKIAYKAVQQISTANVVPVSPTSREVLGQSCPGFRVGRHAVQWCNGASHLLRHSSTKQLYCLPSPVTQDAS